ncbi:hypothetical protein H0H87_011025 [Tephrocybe sp. NHM501043]|nr:hypothetical protein H0H87_011025 [Tephrocybe sp. NHM501043]
MTRLIPFLSVALLVASLPGGLAGPACSKKHYKSNDCVSKCKHGWGWGRKAMGNDRWGGVMRKQGQNETLDDIISRACGFEPSATPSVSEPLGNVQTGSATFSLVPTSSSIPTSLSSSAFANVTSSPIPSVSSSSIHKTSSSAPSNPFTASSVSSAPPKTTHAAPATTSSARHLTTSSTSVAQAKPTTTKAVAPTTSASSGSGASSDVQAYLSGHNTVRAQHGAADLTWSDELASAAQTWANKCVFEHSQGSLGDYGENLAAGTGSSYGISSAIKSWTDEVSQYDPSNPVFSHFTQVVWKATKQVGCAVQACDGIFDSSYGYEAMLSSRLIFLKTLSETGYVLLVLTTIVATGLSCTALLAQAVRTSPKKSWTNNIDAFIIAASYAVVLVASLLYCGKRRIAMRLRLQRITKSNKAEGLSDLPYPVYKYVAQEYVRACLVSYESLPHDAYHEGWGRPGTKYSGIRFRRALLDTIPEIDELTHIVIPTHPEGKPHARMLHHFRFILPLLPVDEDGLTPLHYYDAAIQLARNGGTAALKEQEFEIGIGAAEEILKWYVWSGASFGRTGRSIKSFRGSLNECYLEMMETSSSTQLSLSSENNMK